MGQCQKITKLCITDKMVIDCNLQKEEKAELPIKITFVGIVINSKFGLCENAEKYCDISCHGVV